MKKTARPKNMKLLLLLLPLLGVLAISGCTGSSGISYGNGLVILNWEPSFSSVESLDTLLLRMKIQNQGAVVAEDVTAQVSGIEFKSDWKGTNAVTAFGSMLPPNPSQNTQGETRTADYNIIAPLLPQGITQQYAPFIRVAYFYSTTAIKPITLVNQAELRRIQDAGDTIPTGDTQTTSGPLKVSVNTGKFIKATGQGNLNKFPVTIIIQNTGGGVVGAGGIDIKTSTSQQQYAGLKPDSKADYTLKMKISYPSDRLDFKCAGDVGGTGLSPWPKDTIKEVKFWKGQETEITCEVTINSGNLPLATINDNLLITLGYYYYVDSTTSISVIGKTT